jgi:NAD(P)-dependent dehydrogenase (short-subunit alcohol dehydrogenase family)
MDGGAKIIKTAIDNFGRIDILVNTAGNVKGGPTPDLSEEVWDAVLNVHLKGMFACTQAALREMIKQNSGGRIINITSVAAWRPVGAPSGPAYSTAKAGVLGFTRTLAGEMQKQGITVNAISPKAKTRLFPMTGDTGPEFVAPMIVYLSTDEAKDITGQIIYAGGGAIMVYSPLMSPPWGKAGAHQQLHKKGKWTVDELIKIMPRMVYGGKPGLL